MSLIEQANKLSGYAADVRRWRYAWFTPSKNIEDDNNMESYGFEYKCWQRVGADEPLDLLDDTDDHVLDLNAFDRTRKDAQSKVSQVGGGPTGSGTTGLTMEDIRGAVGGVEAIPGFSSSDAIAKKEQEAGGAASPE
ncbi:AaceriAGL331Cp [[Ashbya] aceris (nom. inval.)]|nr:AaceriAGL331Cp [[Ashbya] aceris (nom. inval.)]